MYSASTWPDCYSNEGQKKNGLTFHGCLIMFNRDPYSGLLSLL